MNWRLFMQGLGLVVLLVCAGFADAWWWTDEIEGPEPDVKKYVITTRCLVAMLIGAGVGLGSTMLGIPFLLGIFGFTAAGVTAGSLAALWQAKIAAVSAGSLFAILQSVAASGFGLLSTVCVTGSAATVAYAFCTAVDCQLGYSSGLECESS